MKITQETGIVKRQIIGETEAKLEERQRWLDRARALLSEIEGMIQREANDELRREHEEDAEIMRLNIEAHKRQIQSFETILKHARKERHYGTE